MVTRYLYLIRHGHYVEDKTHARYGYLDDIGRQQAQYIGAWLARQKIDSVVSSPLPRAVETASLALQAGNLQLASKKLLDLRECVPSVPKKYRHEADWKPFQKPTRLKEKQERLARLFERLTKRPRGRDRHEAFFAHGNVIRYLCCLALEADCDAWINMHIHHGSCSVLTVNAEGRVKLLHYNLIDHLPERLRTH